MSDPETILLVDDDDDYAEAVGTYLDAHGYSVVRGRTGEEGLRLARSRRPDLVLMDVMMEERTEGFFAVQEMGRDPELRDIPVFVVSSIYSAIPGMRVAPEASWLRHDQFLAKPVDLDELLSRIRERLS